MLFEQTGPFFVGCNYWASHAGTRMWSQWDESAVENDLEALRAQGMEVLRVFPLWPDFQPIERIYTGGGYTRDIRMGEQAPAGDDPGLDPVMVQRFSRLLELCRQKGLRVIVSLINGFMSGRLFAPPALQGRPLLSDAESVMWQIRFVSHMVSRFREDPCILAWDLGNECNNIENVASRAEAYRWTACVADAIKTADGTRPVVSGMHSLSPNGIWSMCDQGELTDILTTHPYPYWVRYCDAEPLDTVRPILHAACECLYYAGIGGKPCFVEEFGNMGPFIAGDEATSAYAGACLMTLWAHGCHGALWWCAFDQLPLAFPPYDYCACENELGLLDAQRRPKPILQAIQRTHRAIQAAGPLPPRTVDAVCILGDSPDPWAAAFSSFVLAKQAHMDIVYQLDTQPLQDSPLYLVPSLTGTNGLPKQKMAELLERVQKGAVLYISCDDGYISRFRELTGLEVRARCRRSAPSSLQGEGFPELPFHAAFRYDLTERSAHVLAREPDGNPVFAYASYGQGRIYFLAFPMEAGLAGRPHILEEPEKHPYYRLYETLRQAAASQKAFQADNPHVGMTEHMVDAHTRILVLTNYTARRQTVLLRAQMPFYLPEDSARVALEAHQSLVLRQSAPSQLSLRTIPD